jgi:hypothetical protein
MLRHYFSIALPVTACALTLALSGCAAVPLAQMAATQMAPQSVCMAASACQPAPAAGSFGDMSKGFGDSIRKLTSLVSDSQPVPYQAPMK